MKCPKCGYLGFETGDRCRNCGYDFSLSADRSEPGELPMRSEAEPLGPLADLKLGEGEAPARPARPSLESLDLDRILGAPPGPTTDLPLFTDGAPEEHVLVTPSAPRTPLAVRRSTPETPKVRPRPPARVETLALDLESPPRAVSPYEIALAARRQAAPASEATRDVPVRAGALRRLSAAIIDLTILGIIHAVVIYFTLRLTQIPPSHLGALPWVPLGAFLLLLAAGYFVVFTAVGGQTIGKMAAGTRVVAQGGPVDVPRAVLRFAGATITLLTCGIGYAPALFGARRALHDRLSGTDVIGTPLRD
jgi:uncharacterized RDD family membrane protein YckC